MTRILLSVWLTALAVPAFAVLPPVPYVPAEAARQAAMPMPDAEPSNPDDPAAIADRITENTKLAGDRLASADPGDQTRSTQNDVLNDIDKLLKLAENPPPQGGGGGGGSPPPESGGDPSGGMPPPMGGSGDPSGGMPPPMGGGGPMGGMPPMDKPSHGDEPGDSRSAKADGKPKPESGSWRDRAGRERGAGSPMPKPGGPEPVAVKPMPGDGPKAKAGEPGGGPGEDGGTGGQAKPSLPLDDPYTKEVWGHLPEQMRRQMTQYYREQFVSKYGDLLRQYYSSLAEKDNAGRSR